MRVGEHVFCSLDSGCKPCPVCNSKVRPLSLNQQPALGAPSSRAALPGLVLTCCSVVGQGVVKCSHCKGTGLRAGWLEPGCPT